MNIIDCHPRMAGLLRTEPSKMIGKPVRSKKLSSEEFDKVFCSSAPVEGRRRHR